MEEESVSMYVKLMAEHSRTRQHELIEQCLIENHICGVKELKVSQAKEFCERHGIYKS